MSSYIDLMHSKKGYLVTLHWTTGKEFKSQEVVYIRNYEFTKKQFCSFLRHLDKLLHVDLQINVL